MRRMFMICCSVTVLFFLPVFSWGADREELAPGYDRCMESATGASDMLQCGKNAYLYWEEKLTESYKNLWAICNALEGHSSEQCREHIAKIEKSGQEYREQGMDLIHLFYGEGDDVQMARLEAQRFNIVAAQKQASAMGSMACPALDNARAIFERQTLLWERGIVKNFDVLSDDILDSAVLGVYNTGVTPLDAGCYLRRDANPELFKASKQNFDLALHAATAADIATYFFGRPAPLRNVTGEYLYGNQADGPVMCRGKMTGVSAAASGIAVRGAIFCMEDPVSEKETRNADMEILLEKNAKAPLGWIVHSVHTHPAGE